MDAAAAEQLSRLFVSFYGVFSPANPKPGQTWIDSWRAWATDNAVTQATQNFDRLWSWAWDQRSHCTDVTVTGPVEVQQQFGTAVVKLPAKRYVLNLLAPAADAGFWQNLMFTVTVGPRARTGTSTDPELAVFLVSMTVLGQG